MTYSKTAACPCGALTVTANAPPEAVHACSCTDCQRGSGSAFTYSAFFAKSALTVGGEVKVWRRVSQSGRWQDCSFCPTCGTTVFSELEALPGVVCVSVGCFADPEFAAPGKLYWSSRRHQWLDMPDGIELVENQ